MPQRLSLPALAAALTLSLAASVANATVYIGLQQDGGPIVQKASGATPTVPVTFNGNFGQFEGLSVSGLGQPGAVLPLLLQSTALANNNAGKNNAGVLTIYVTSTDNTNPLGTVDFTSGLATVNLTPGWTEKVSTYLDPGNHIFDAGLTTLLATATFNDVQASKQTLTAHTGLGPYSVTAVYVITAPSRGASSSQAGIRGTSIVEPTSLAVLGTALAGFGIAARRRRKAA